MCLDTALEPRQSVAVSPIVFLRYQSLFPLKVTGFLSGLLSPFLIGRTVNILRTVRRTRIRFLIELK